MLRYRLAVGLALVTSATMAARELRADPPVVREQPGRLLLLSNEDAWKRLPGAPEKAATLPPWARMLAAPLPLTTARMLELDALHRSGDRLDARLRGLVRWAAADANGCAYGKAIAAADLRRAGVATTELETLAKKAAQLPLADRLAMDFARKMMREAHAVTDAEFKQLLDVLGEDRVVALVALLAHASFQDRIILALDVQVEPEGSRPPLKVAFTQPKASAHRPPSNPAAKAAAAPPVITRTPAQPAWRGLQESMELQRARTGRIRVPSREEVLERLGKNHPAAWQTGILWSRVCYGFQPELTDSWFACVSALRQESDLDRVFTQCIFWIVTQSSQCFY